MKRLTKTCLQNFIYSLRLEAMNDCEKAHEASTGTTPNLVMRERGCTKRHVANELQALLDERP